MASTMLDNMKRVAQANIDAINEWNYEKVNAIYAAEFKFQALPSSLKQAELDKDGHRYLWHNILTPIFKKFRLNPLSQIFDVEQKKAVVSLTIDLTIPNGQEFRYDMIQFLTFSDDGNEIVRLEEFFDSKSYLGILAAVDMEGQTLGQ